VKDLTTSRRFSEIIINHRPDIIFIRGGYSGDLNAVTNSKIGGDSPVSAIGGYQRAEGKNYGYQSHGYFIHYILLENSPRLRLGQSYEVPKVKKLHIAIKARTQERYIINYGN
jgi:hypothetical protein